jgi:hypothetical protein
MAKREREKKFGAKTLTVIRRLSISFRHCLTSYCKGGGKKVSPSHFRSATRKKTLDLYLRGRLDKRNGQNWSKCFFTPKFFKFEALIWQFRESARHSG